MTRAEQAVRLLGLVVARSRRARFVEELRSDLADAHSFGVSREAVLLAACRTALLLLGLRTRDALRHSRRLTELVAAGVFVGLLLAVAAVPSAVLMPLVLLAVAVRRSRAAPARPARAPIDATR